MRNDNKRHAKQHDSSSPPPFHPFIQVPSLPIWQRAAREYKNNIKKGRDEDEQNKEIETKLSTLFVCRSKFKFNNKKHRKSIRYWSKMHSFL
jgi:hypothetical protein